ncbi:hypothetical protein RFI_04835, partial [Reticulomyxa filosa]
ASNVAPNASNVAPNTSNCVCRFLYDIPYYIRTFFKNIRNNFFKILMECALVSFFNVVTVAIQVIFLSIIFFQKKQKKLFKKKLFLLCGYTKLTDCVKIDGEYRLWAAGDHKCQPWWQLFVIPLFAFPVILIAANWKKVRCGNLGASFKIDMWWYEASNNYFEAFALSCLLVICMLSTIDATDVSWIQQAQTYIASFPILLFILLIFQCLFKCIYSQFVDCTIFSKKSKISRSESARKLLDITKSTPLLDRGSTTKQVISSVAPELSKDDDIGQPRNECMLLVDPKDENDVL